MTATTRRCLDLVLIVVTSAAATVSSLLWLGLLFATGVTEATFQGRTTVFAVCSTLVALASGAAYVLLPPPPAAGRPPAA